MKEWTNMLFQIKNLSKEQADCFLVILKNDIGDSCTIMVDGNCEGEKTENFKKIIEVIEEIEKL
jgi:hypothetical protein